MPPSDTQRLELFETLIDKLGDKAAATLMEYLPPGGWENIATKDDLERLTGELEHAMARQTRTMVFTMLGIAITIWLALLLPAVAV